MEKPAGPSTETSITEDQRRFMEVLSTFMEQCYILIEAQTAPKLTEEERVAKITAITSLIQEKEKELSQLEAQRVALNALTTGTQVQKSTTADGTQCEPDCPADCSNKTNASKTPRTRRNPPS